MKKNDNYNNLVSDNISLTEILGYTIDFVKKYIKYFGLSLMLGVLAGFLYFKLAKYSYESSFTAYANHLKDVQVREIVGSLNKMIKEKDYKQLSDSLHISISTAYKISQLSVSINGEIEKDKEEEEAKSGNSFKLTAVVSDNIILDTLQTAIGQFLGNNIQAKRIKALSDSSSIIQINKVISEISYLDNMQERIYNQLGSQSKIQILDPAAVSTRIVELQEKLEGLKYAYNMNKKEMVVIQSFIPFRKQASPRLIISVVTGAIIGLLLGLIIAFVQDARSKA